MTPHPLRARRFPVLVKFLLAGGVVIAALAVSTVLAQRTIGRAATEVVGVRGELAEIKGNVDEFRAIAATLVLARELADAEGAERERARGQLAREVAEVRKGLDGLTKEVSQGNNSEAAEELAAVKRTQQTFEAFVAAAGRLDRAGEDSPARAELGRRMDEAFLAYAQVNQGMGDTHLSEADTGVQEVSDRARAAGRNLLVVALVGAVLGMIALLVLVRSVRRNVAQVVDRLNMLRDNCTTDLRQGLEKVATGDLTAGVVPVTPRIERFTNDELGDVARSVNDIREKSNQSTEAYNSTRAALSELIGQVSETATSLSAASEEMATTSEEAGRAVSEIAHPAPTSPKAPDPRRAPGSPPPAPRRR